MPRTDCRKLLLLLQNIGAAAYPQPRCTVYASFLSVCNTFSTCLHPNIHVYLCWGARHQKATQSNTCCALVVLLQIHSQAAPVSLLCALSATLFEVLVPKQLCCAGGGSQEQANFSNGGRNVTRTCRRKCYMQSQLATWTANLWHTQQLQITNPTACVCRRHCGAGPQLVSRCQSASCMTCNLCCCSITRCC